MELRDWKLNDRGEATVTNAGVASRMFTPTLNGVATAEVTLDAGTGNSVIGLRATINPGDSIVAANRLMNGYPDCVFEDLGESIRITSDKPITNLSLVGIGTATNAAGNVISTVENQLSNVQSAMVEFTFNSSDNLRLVEITLSSAFNGGQNAHLHIGGAS